MEGIYDQLSDMLSNFDFDSFRGIFGSELSDDMIANSIQTASDFFGIENPSWYLEPSSTGVFLHDTHSFGDDVLSVDMQQLHDMGINTQDGLDLVMTHETTHRMLQGIDGLDFTSPQEELCCDFMSGVRAGLNGIDATQFESSLYDTTGSDSHPVGSLRVDAIQDGIDFAHSYMAEHSTPPTFHDCLDYFTQNDMFTTEGHGIVDPASDIASYNHAHAELEHIISANMSKLEFCEAKLSMTDNPHEIEIYQQQIDEAKHEIATAEADMARAEHHFNDPRDITIGKPQSTESLGSIANGEETDKHAFSSDGISFKRSQAEINNDISKAESRKAHAEKNMRDNATLMNIKGDDPHDFEKHQYNMAKNKYDKAKEDLSKLRSEKPDKK